MSQVCRSLCRVSGRIGRCRKQRQGKESRHRPRVDGRAGVLGPPALHTGSKQESSRGPEDRRSTGAYRSEQAKRQGWELLEKGCTDSLGVPPRSAPELPTQGMFKPPEKSRLQKIFPVESHFCKNKPKNPTAYL